MTPEPSLLIFQWGAQYRKPLKWLFTLLAAAAVHAILLYFVRVSPRAVVRSIPLQGSVTLLSMDFDEHAALLTRLNDKSSLLPQSGQTFPGDLTFGALPKFQRPDYEPKFRPLPQEALPMKRGGALSVTDDMSRYLPATQLPPAVPVARPSTTLKGTPDKDKAREVSWRATGGLAARLRPDLSLPFPPLADRLAYAFQIGVNAGGRVVFALPLRSGDSQVRDALLKQIHEVSFLPQADVPLAWGTLEPVP